MMTGSKRKIVIVTGASRGIGAQISLELSKQFDLILIARKKTALQTIASQCQLNGSFVEALEWDLSLTPPNCQDIFQGALKRENLWGLVNNAGSAYVKSISDMSEADLDYLYRLNFRSPYFLMQSVLTELVRNSTAGRIINIASVSGIYRVPKFPGFSAYAATKAALIAATESLAAEFRPFNISINCISPGAVDTDLFTKVAPLGSQAPLKSQDVSSVVSFLLQESHASVSGVNWEVWTG